MNIYRASDIVKTKLVTANGSAKIRLQRGDECLIKLIPANGKLQCDKLPLQNIDFSIFDIVMDFLAENKGYAKKGAIRGPQNNVGFGKCGPETVTYQIATKYYRKEIGETAYDPLFVIAGVLEWAGLVENGYGYLKSRIYWEQ